MAATRKPRVSNPPAVPQGPAQPRPCWLVVHELHDQAAPALAAALAEAAAASGVDVRAVSVPALMSAPGPGVVANGARNAAEPPLPMGGVRWCLRVQGDGSSCTLDAPGLALQAGAADADGTAPGGARRARLAGVVNRCGPVSLPAGAPDADYKSAEWNALLAAWLHGLCCPVINRPRPHNLQAATMGPARWRQAAAAAGLPVWPLRGQDAWPQALGDAPGLLVVGPRVFEAAAPTLPRWPARAHRAAAAAAARAGCELLAWTGRPDAQGRWRISGATPWPDLRPFGPAAGAALAQALGAAP